MMVMTAMLTYIMTILMTMLLKMTMIMKGHLKVFDGLLPITSEAVDDTRGETIHKPEIIVRIIFSGFWFSLGS